MRGVRGFRKWWSLGVWSLLRGRNRAALGRSERAGDAGGSEKGCLECEGGAQPLSKRAMISAGRWMALRWKSGSESLPPLRRG